MQRETGEIALGQKNSPGKRAIVTKGKQADFNSFATYAVQSSPC